MKWFFLRKKEKEFFVSLDIGSQAIKSLIFKKEKGKFFILKSFLEYFEKDGDLEVKEDKSSSRAEPDDRKVRREKRTGFSSNPFAAAREIEIIKKNFSFAAAWIKEKKGKIKSLIIGLPSHALKEKIYHQLLIRENETEIIKEKEKNEIYQKIFQRTKKQVSQKLAGDFGILPEDFHFLSLRVLEIKINGYEIPVLEGYQGKNLEFKILAAFLPKVCFENHQKIFKELNFRGEEGLSYLSQTQGLISFVENNERSDGIYLDIGAKLTKIFIFKNKKIEALDEFPVGANFFDEKLSQKLAMGLKEARILKEKYSKKLLSLETTNKIKEFFSFEKNEWFKNLKIKLAEMTQIKIFPSTIFIFGGGSLLEEIKEILENGDWQEFFFIDGPKVKFIYPSVAKGGDEGEALSDYPSAAKGGDEGEALSDYPRAAKGGDEGEALSDYPSAARGGEEGIFFDYSENFKNIEKINKKDFNNPQYTPNFLFLLDYEKKT